MLENILHRLPARLSRAMVLSTSTRHPCIVALWRAGQRRLELFGEDRNIRPGWVTVGRQLTSSNFDPEVAAADVQPATSCATSAVLGPHLDPNSVQCLMAFMTE
jgi:hypothetical protein